MFRRAKALAIYSCSFFGSLFVSFVVLTILWGPSLDDTTPSAGQLLHHRAVKRAPLDLYSQASVPSIALESHITQPTVEASQPSVGDGLSNHQPKVNGEFQNDSSFFSPSDNQLQEPNSTLQPIEKSRNYSRPSSTKSKISLSRSFPTKSQGKTLFRGLTTEKPINNKSLFGSFPPNMPFHEYIRSGEEVMKSGWVAKLSTFLKTVDKTAGSPHVNVVFGDFEHKLLVLNWVTAALVNMDPPLHNVLVLSLDRKLCHFLTNRDLPVTCIAVSVESLLSLQRSGGGGGRGRKKERMWKMGMMVRLPFIRLISYWGYDVASYDSDAVLLINPRSLYDESPNVHLFSSAGTFPLITSQRWGFTLCAGALFFRASPEVETLWKHISSIHVLRDEQISINKALEDMGIAWRSPTPAVNRCAEREGWEGEEDGGLHVYVFPQHVFCRRGCCTPGLSREELYLVHPFSVKNKVLSKVNALKKMNSWFLSKNDV